VVEALAYLSAVICCSLCDMTEALAADSVELFTRKLPHTVNGIIILPRVCVLAALCQCVVQKLVFVRLDPDPFP